MGRETYFPHLAILVPERQSCACLRGQYTLRKITGTQINVPRLNLHKRPRHRRCPTSRDFVPWRFSDAGRRTAWIASSCRHPKTCTEAEVIGAFGHGVEPLPTTARGTLRAVLQCNRHLAPARQMSEISCQSHLEAAVSLNSS